MKYIFTIFAFAFAFATQAQRADVSWSTSIEQLKDQSYKLSLIADIPEGFYIYSQYIEEGGPVPTEISFSSDNLNLQEKVAEKGEVEKELFDPVFEIDIKKFGEKATFSQIAKTNEIPTDLKASVIYMICNDHMCLPPKKVDVSFASEKK